MADVTASIKSPRELSSIVSTRVLSLIANRLNDKTITRPPLLFVHFFVDTFFDLSIFVSLSNRLILSRVKFHTFFSLSLFPRLFVTVRRNSLPPPRVTIIYLFVTIASPRLITRVMICNECNNVVPMSARKILNWK